MTTANQAKAAAFNDIEWDSVEGGNTEFTTKYPRFQWVHGEAKASGINKSGGLFVSADEYPNFSAKGFDAAELILRDATEVKGYAAARPRLAVIRIKHQWVKNDEGRNVPLAHALVVVEGNEDLVCISLKGSTKALDFQKAFEAHMGQNVSLANRTRPQGVPALEPFALWFPLVSGTLVSVQSKDGKSKSTVTPPVLATPEKLDINYVRSLWVGAENYKKFAGLYRETAAWQKLPIWEQRNGDDHADEFSGAELATDEQFHHFVNICTAKGFDEREIVMGITNGFTSEFMELSRDDARKTIEAIKNK